MTINMHDKVSDVVSGAVGRVVARTLWDNGCVRFTVQPPVGADGKIPESFGLDEGNAVLLESAEPFGGTGEKGGPPVYGEPSPPCQG